jgi:alpha-beta hydrolase superfamily lysophospholipase
VTTFGGTAAGGFSASVFLERGFAIAASNYGSGGFCIQAGVNSTYQLTRYIIDTYHVTGKVFLIGISMGGAVALLLGEKYPKLYSGVLDMFGTKDLKDQYNTKSRWINLSDAELTAELTALTSPIPVTLGASTLNLAGLRTVCTTNVADYVFETGGTPATQPKTYEDDSPTYHANITIPVITVQGTSDAIVPFYETLMYKTAVANAGRSNLYRLYNVTGGTHGSSDVMNELPVHFAELVAWSEAINGWTMTVDGRSMKAYPDLKETVWVKNATMPPNGQYDKIGLHRLVKTGVVPKGVVFLTNCPTWGTGEVRISNPANDTFTKYENYSQAIYWANRGFDVYAIDYRSHFVPKTLNASQLSFAANWGLDVWVSDIKEAAEKVKAVSGSSKFFISGECTGGMAALNYATKYWKTDLKGIILLDANLFSQGYPIVGRTNETNTFNLTASLISMNASATWGYDPYATLRPAAAYALQNPGAPAEYPPGTPLSPAINPATNRTWANITEYFTNAATALGVLGTTGNITQVLYCFANSEFLPTRVRLEAQAMTGWVNCPDLTYDYNDHYNEIGVPLIAFESGLFANSSGTLRFVNGINNTDFTGVMLPNYGHLDLYTGTKSAQDVSQPALQWMLGHLLTLDITARTSVTVLSGWTWWFFAQNLGGNAPYTYQWYEGLTPIQGQTSMLLPVTKTAPGVYSFYCRVTDKDGTTTTSNAVTLTVIG